MNQYSYKGPVMEFERCIDNCWEATTWAATEAKARSNLTYRYKKEHNKIPSVRITLPGKIVMINGKE